MDCLESVGVIVGSILTGAIADTLGRKSSLLVSALPGVIGWFLLAAPSRISLIYTGRLLTGVSAGLGNVPVIVYTAEIATQSLRPALTTTKSLSVAIGVTLVFFLGWAFQGDWQVISLISACFALVGALLCLIFLVESPVWLMSKGRFSEASAALRYIRGASCDEQIQEEIMSLMQASSVREQQPTTLRSLVYDFKQPQTYKPLCIMIFFFLFEELSGFNIVIMYAAEMLEETGVSAENVYGAAMLIALGRLLGSMLAPCAANYGRRLPSIVSGIFMAACMLTLAFQLQFTFPYTSQIRIALAEELTQTGFNGSAMEQLEYTITNETNITMDWYDVSNIVSAINRTDEFDPNMELVSKDWLPVCIIFIFIVMASLGYHTVPWSMLGEVYPMHIRGVAGGITVVWNELVSFILLKIYPEAITVMHNYGVFYFFGGATVIGTMFVVGFVPETGGLALQEIENIFSSKGNSKDRLVDERTPFAVKNKMYLDSCQNVGANSGYVKN